MSRDSISMDLAMLFANPVIQPLMLCIASLNEEDESRIALPRSFLSSLSSFASFIIRWSLCAADRFLSTCLFLLSTNNGSGLVAALF